MRITVLKYLVVLTCILAVLQRAGVSVSAIYNKSVIAYSDLQTANDDEDTSKPDASKESELKEYWAIHPRISFLQVYNVTAPVMYTDHRHHGHLGWIAPVPTPPPNFRA